ncbi:MAG: DnaB-like helicase C-terminal domain-containing protein [Gordonia sp. (in: high G+C Gram-positive bacteria)]
MSMTTRSGPLTAPQSDFPAPGVHPSTPGHSRAPQRTIAPSLDDEKILVSTILSITNPDADLIDRIQPEDLTGWNAKIWAYAAACRADGQPTTPRAILARAGGDIVLRQNLDTLTGLSWPIARIRDAEHHVRELGRLRRLEDALRGALERLGSSDSYSVALENTHGELGRLDGANPPTEVHDFADAWDRWWDHTTGPITPRAKPIPTPWPAIDTKLAGGLHRGRTYVIGARPGGGKSLAGANIALHAAENDHRAVIFSVEMGEIEITSRIVAAGAEAEYKQITTRTLDDHNRERIAEWGDTYRTMPLHLVDNADIGVEYVASVCRTLKRTHGDLAVVFVDYLQLLRPGALKAPRHEQIGAMSRALKVLAMDLDVAIVIACQLNRGSAGEKRAPRLDDLRESGSIEQDCDVAILLHHPDGQPGDVELIVAKNRTGGTGTITCRWAAYQSRIKP